jgi:hypothetical protein
VRSQERGAHAGMAGERMSGARADDYAPGERFMNAFRPVMDWYESNWGTPQDIRLYGVGPVTYDPPVAFVWAGPGVEVPHEIGGITVLAEPAGLNR